MELRGKAVIVTGASRGLGAALAEALGRAGARLVLISRDREALGSVVERIRAGGGEAHAVVASNSKMLIVEFIYTFALAWVVLPLVSPGTSLPGNAGWIVALLGEGKQKVLGGDKFVLETGGLVEGALQHLVERLREIRSRLHAAGLRLSGQETLGFGQNGVRPHAALLDDRPDHPLLLLRQGDQQVEREDHLALIFFGNRLGLLQGFLGLLGELI